MSLLDNTGLVFLCALAAVFAFPQYSQASVALILPSLMVAMALSLKDYAFDAAQLKSYAGKLATFVGFNYILLTAFYVLFAPFFFSGQVLIGIMLIAATPPAIAVVARSFLFGGEVKLAYYSALAGYAASLVLMPLLVWVLASGSVSPAGIAWYAFLFVLLPFAASRALRKMDKVPRRGLVNLAFAVGIYGTVSPNRLVFTSQFWLVMALAAFSVIRIAATMAIAHVFAKRSGYSAAERTSLYWFASIKNTGFAAFLALTLIGPLAALPAAVDTFVDVVFTAAYDRFRKKR